MPNLSLDQLLEQKRSPWQIACWWIIGFLGLGLFLAVVLHMGELERIFLLLKDLQALWIIMAVILQSLSYAAAACVWHQTLIYIKHPVGFRSLYALSIAQLFAKQALPSSGLSGAVIVLKGLLNRGLKEADGMGCLVVGMVVYYAAYCLAILISLSILYFRHAASGWLTGSAAAFCLLAIIVPVAVLWLRHLELHHRLPAFISRRALPCTVMHMLAEAPVEALKQPKLMAKTILLQLSVFMIDAMTLEVMLQAVGYAQPYDIVFASFVMASVVGAVLPIPLGLGTFEGTCVTMLHLFGVTLEAALIAVLLLRSFTCWLPMIPGLWLIQRELRHKPA